MFFHSAIAGRVTSWRRLTRLLIPCFHHAVSINARCCTHHGGGWLQLKYARAPQCARNFMGFCQMLYHFIPPTFVRCPEDLRSLALRHIMSIWSVPASYDCWHLHRNAPRWNVQLIRMSHRPPKFRMSTCPTNPQPHQLNTHHTDTNQQQHKTTGRFPHLTIISHINS